MIAIRLLVRRNLVQDIVKRHDAQSSDVRAGPDYRIAFDFDGSGLNEYRHGLCSHMPRKVAADVAQNEVDGGTTGMFQVFAKKFEQSCERLVFGHVYEVAPSHYYRISYFDHVRKSTEASLQIRRPFAPSFAASLYRKGESLDHAVRAL